MVVILERIGWLVIEPIEVLLDFVQRHPLSDGGANGLLTQLEGASLPEQAFGLFVRHAN